MATTRHKPEEIVTKLRQVEVLVGRGLARVDAIREVRIAQQKVSTPAPKKPTEPPRKKKKAKKQKKPKGGVLAEGKAKGNHPKKKRVKQYYDPYEKPSRPVIPLSDAPVSYILKKLDKAADEPFNPHKIDWDVT